MAEPVELPTIWSARNAYRHAEDMLRRVDAVTDPVARELLVELISIFRAQCYDKAGDERPEIAAAREAREVSRQAQVQQRQATRRPWWRIWR